MEINLETNNKTSPAPAIQIYNPEYFNLEPKKRSKLANRHTINKPKPKTCIVCSRALEKGSNNFCPACRNKSIWIKMNAFKKVSALKSSASKKGWRGGAR